MLAVFLYIFPPYFWRQDLSLNLEFMDLARLADQQASWIYLSVPFFPALGLQVDAAASDFCMDAGYLNLGPYARIASFLLTKSSHQDCPPSLT